MKSPHSKSRKNSKLSKRRTQRRRIKQQGGFLPLLLLSNVAPALLRMGPTILKVGNGIYYATSKVMTYGIELSNSIDKIEKVSKIQERMTNLVKPKKKDEAATASLTTTSTSKKKE